MNTLYQLWGIARTEYRMQWRQRGMIVITLAILLVFVVSVILVVSDVRELRGHSVENTTFYQASTDAVTSLTFILIVTQVSLLLPFVLVNLIPKDRQVGVVDILQSTPLNSPTYLTGKLLGGWLTVFSGLVPCALIMGILWYVAVSPYRLSAYLETWVVGILPLAFINVGLVILLAFRMPDSRMAVLVAIIVIILPLFAIGFEPRNDWLDIFNPFRPGIFLRYANVVGAEAEKLSPALTIISGMGQVGVAWVGAVAWQRWRNGY